MIHYLKILSIVFFGFISINVQADFYVNYYSDYGISGSDGQNGIIPNIGDTALIQLLYAGENDQIDSITDYNLSTGDDVILDSFSYTNDGSEFAEYVATTFGTVTSPYVGNGYIYGRIFSDLLPTVGTTYYVGSLMQAADIDTSVTPPFLPISYNLGNGLNQTASQTLNFNTNEPIIISLTVSNGVGGTVSPSGSTIFYQSTPISIQATPELGYTFSQWLDENGNSKSIENPFSSVLSQSETFIASFEPDLSDEDQDGLSLFDEVIIYGSDPNESDTSGDGLLDGVLVLMGLEPTINFSNLVNTVQTTPESFGVFSAAYVQNQENTISSLNELVLSKNENISNLENINASLLIQITGLDEQNDNLNNQVSSLTEQNNQLSSSITSLSQEVLSLEEQVVSLSESNQQLISSNNSLNEQNNLLSQQINSLENSNASLELSNSQLQDSVNDLTSQNSSFAEQLTSLQAANVLLNEQLAILSPTNTNNDLAEQILILQNTNTFLNAVVSELIDENIGLEYTNEYISVSLNNTLEENNDLQNQVIELELAVVDLEEALQDSYVDYEYPWWKEQNSWWHSWHKPNNYWWGWGNPPARNLPKWGRDVSLGKRLKMKRLKKRRNNYGNDIAEMEVEFCVEQSSDLTSGEWSSTTNNISLDIPVDDNAVKFYRIIYN